VEFKAFGENQILDLLVANEDTNVICCYFWVDVILSMVHLDRNSKDYEMVHL